MVYKIIAAISVLFRQFVLPNPFEPLGEKFNVNLFNITLSLTPDIANWIAEPVLHLLAFGITGLYYARRYNDPAAGSFLYLLFYVIHTLILILMSAAGFAWWAVVLLLIIYIAGHIGINLLIRE